MTLGGALGVAALAVAACLLLLSALIALRRASRLHGQRARAERIAPLRPLLIELAAADAPDPRLHQQLAALGSKQWREVEAALAALIGKVRGESRAALVVVLVRRGTVARARRRTRAWLAVRRARAAELLGSTADPAGTDALVHLLADRNREVRIVAARALGRVRAPGAAEALLCALEGRRPVPASVVSYSLLQLGVGAEPTLLAGARSPAALTRGVAVEVLGLLGTASAMALLVGLLRRDPSPEVRVRAARALGRIGLPAALPPLLWVVGGAGPEPLRVVAVGALGDLGDAGAAGPLRQMLGDPSLRVAAAAGRALLAIGPPGLSALAATAVQPGHAPAALHAREALARGALTGRFVDDATLAALAAPGAAGDHAAGPARPAA